MIKRKEDRIEMALGEIDGLRAEIQQQKKIIAGQSVVCRRNEELADRAIAEEIRLRTVVIQLAKRHAGCDRDGDWDYACDRDDDWDYAIDCLGETLRRLQADPPDRKIEN